MASSSSSSSSSRPLLLFLTCLHLLLAPANGALPPLPTWRREELATVIATGVLEETNSTIVGPEGQRLSIGDLAKNPDNAIRHRIFDGSLRVSAVHKQPSTSPSSSKQIAVGDKLVVSFRRVMHPGGMVGALGQNSLAFDGEHLKIYATSYGSLAETPKHYRKVARGEVYLLEPNGFDRLKADEDGWHGSREGTGELHGGAGRGLGAEAGPEVGSLIHSRRRGFNGPLVLARDVTKEECDWLDGDLRKGDEVHLFHGHTYGVIGKSGVAVTKTRDGDTPFFELPADALEAKDGARWDPHWGKHGYRGGYFNEGPGEGL